MPGILAALAFVGLHALVHIWETVASFPASGHAGLVDLAGVYGPPIVLLLIIAWAQLRPRLKEA